MTWSLGQLLHHLESMISLLLLGCEAWKYPLLVSSTICFDSQCALMLRACFCAPDSPLDVSPWVSHRHFYLSFNKTELMVLPLSVPPQYSSPLTQTPPLNTKNQQVILGFPLPPLLIVPLKYIQNPLILLSSIPTATILV